MKLVDGEFSGSVSESDQPERAHLYMGHFVGGSTIIYLARVYDKDDRYVGQLKGSFLREDLSAKQVEVKVTALVETALETTPDLLKFSGIQPGGSLPSR